MPSSLTLPAADHPTRREQLLDALERVPDPRDPRGKRYPPPSVLALAITATIAGARSFAAIGQWGRRRTRPATGRVRDLGAGTGSLDAAEAVHPPGCRRPGPGARGVDVDPHPGGGRVTGDRPGR